MTPHRPRQAPTRHTGLRYEGRCRDFYSASTAARRATAAQIWNAARHEVSLAPLGEETIWRLPYFHVENVHSAVCADDASIAYKTVWKGGNHFFHTNLAESCNASTELLVDRTRSLLFSFVRDPAARFVSAYREVAYRLRTLACDAGGIGAAADALSQMALDCEDFRRQPVEVAEGILRHFLDGYQLPNGLYRHFALMSAFLLSSPPYPDFFGRLECAEGDWARMCRRTRCPAALDAYTKLNQSLGEHPRTSGDPSGYGAALEALLRARPRWAAAVERLIALDVACFDTCTLCPRHGSANATAGPSAAWPAPASCVAGLESEPPPRRVIGGATALAAAALIIASAALTRTARSIRAGHARTHELVPTTDL